MDIMFPISLCKRIEKVAKSRNSYFDDAVLFLLQKAEAPIGVKSSSRNTASSFLSKKVEAPHE